MLWRGGPSTAILSQRGFLTLKSLNPGILNEMLALSPISIASASRVVLPCIVFRDNESNNQLCRTLASKELVMRSQLGNFELFAPSSEKRNEKDQ